jgi:hypothetical protein
MSDEVEKMSSDDQKVVQDFNDKFKAGLDAMEKAKQISVGDFLILYVGNQAAEMKVQTNSYGAPIKYKVVYSSEHSIPFVKRVNKNGTPTGRLFSCIGGLDSDTFRDPGQRFEFVLDPDYADAILLEDKYDPAQLHKSKQDIFKAVTQHNKANKINTSTMMVVDQFFQTVNVGDTLWTSNTSFYLVQGKKTIFAKDFNENRKWKDCTRLKQSAPITILTVRDKNSKEKEIPPDFFWGKALYKTRPRSYKELNI